MEKKVDESWKEQVEREKRMAPPGRVDARGLGAEAPGAASPAPGQSGPGRGPEPRGGSSPSNRGAQVPETDFGFFLSSLSMQAMVALGEVPHPTTNMPQENLEQARYFIDLLGMLQEKTKGNLNPEEESILEGVLYELRMKYMAHTQGTAP